MLILSGSVEWAFEMEFQVGRTLSLPVLIVESRTKISEPFFGVFCFQALFPFLHSFVFPLGDVLMPCLRFHTLLFTHIVCHTLHWYGTFRFTA